MQGMEKKEHQSHLVSIKSFMKTKSPVCTAGSSLYKPTSAPGTFLMLMSVCTKYSAKKSQVNQS